MLSDQEQNAVTDLTNALYTTHQALIDDVDERRRGSRHGTRREARDAERYKATTGPLQAQMMSFASNAHARLYTPEQPDIVPARRGRTRRSGRPSQ